MASLTFTIPSVLNQGGGEKKVEISASDLTEAFAKISETMGDDFKRRVLESDGTPRSLINIYINGKNAKFSSGMDTELKDGDDIYILPAVAGGSELSSKELDRYSRQVMLEEIGYEGQLKLRNSKVCVVGVGGLGNPITTRLVAMGIGTIRIVDRDVIELSNLHRQTLFDESDVGEVKVEAAAKKLQKLNPDVKIEALPISVNDYTALEVVEGCDVVIGNASIFTSGFNFCNFFAATSTLTSPTSLSSNNVCLCKLDSSITSLSTIRIVPTPIATSRVVIGFPKPPTPTTQNFALQSFNCPS